MAEAPSTDGEEQVRTQAVFIRRDDEVSAMAWGQRVKTKMKNFVGVHDSDERHPNEDEEMQQGGDKQVQYRLEATVRKRAPLWKKVLTCGGFWGNLIHPGAQTGINPNQRLAMYLHWMFRVNFGFLFAIMCAMFFALVIGFAGFITLAGQLDHECVRIGGQVFDAEGAAFADAFALSWTTFSTVGYGSTYPALGYQNESPTNCFFINFICSLESLIGVLYSGFCGAILFGKVLRIQSHAQVIFSDPIVIRYGPGVKSPDGEESDEDKSPCPVLEFRLVNRLFNEVGGEIMDATLNVVANVDAVDSDPLGLSSNPAYSSNMSASVDTSTSDSGSNRSTTDSYRSDGSRFVKNFINGWGRGNQTFLEDPTSRLVTKHIFSKMTVEAGDHPFFKRVWLARHVLDEHSPIVVPRVRRQIRKNGGAWPDRLNTHETIRESINFNQILVSLNGVSNVSASDVYAQKIYDFVDINVGYQFVNILYRDSDGTLGVDTDLINDVREQNGGGGEPLILEE
mmetsp:Transcript_2004/g.4385  ORF Transcript_2004/g.4385 Transcript_2004/m.4385 type:complete len:510 (+) Transcript_2004:125-1654(+)